MDRKTASDILGVSEDAAREEISRNYMVLQKKYRLEQSGQGTGTLDIQAINKAYNILMDYNDEEDTPEQNRSQKVENFFYYHKFKVVGAVFLLIVIFITMRSVFVKVKPDVDITFVGAIYSIGADPLVEKLKPALPDIKNIEAVVRTISPEMKENDLAESQQSQVDLVEGTIDVCVLDEKYFQIFADMGLLQPLDELGDRMNINKKNNENNMRQAKGDQEKHLYGIDITKSKLLNDSNIMGEKKIIAIGKNAKHPDNAVKLVEYLVSEYQKQ